MVKLLGEIDHATSDVVAAALRPVVAPKPPEVVVDCSHLRFIDGGGVGALVTGWLAADGGTRFEIKGGSEILRRMISILGIDELLTVTDSTEGIRPRWRSPPSMTWLWWLDCSRRTPSSANNSASPRRPRRRSPRGEDGSAGARPQRPIVGRRVSPPVRCASVRNARRENIHRPSCT